MSSAMRSPSAAVTSLCLQGGSEKLSDEAIEETLEKVVKLLAYISDKDLFAEFYRKRLARRLLQVCVLCHNMHHPCCSVWLAAVYTEITALFYSAGCQLHGQAVSSSDVEASVVCLCCVQDKSASDDHERSILTRLKQQCGAQFTSKMEGMVTDLQLAREKQQAFDEWKQNTNKQLPIDLSVTVLTTGACRAKSRACMMLFLQTASLLSPILNSTMLVCCHRSAKQRVI